MDRDLVRKHIESVDTREQSLVAVGVIDGCWPGGGADRSEPAARDWLRRWRPDRAEATLPLCSCWAGRCALCN